MSRIGKKPITIPNGVEIFVENDIVKAKGPKGESTLTVFPDILVEKKENELIVSPKHNPRRFGAVWGLTRALLQNCIDGVSAGFERRLEIIGVGFRAAKDGDRRLKLEVGFSHDVFLDVPEGLNVAVEKNIIIVTGNDKQKVGQFAANIRAVKKPEPYKGKGIRYLGEKVRRKEGKKAAGK